MKRENWIVTQKSERPARPDGTCFYCSRKIGESHKEDCVIRKRSVVIEFKIQVVTKEPEDWSPENIEFRYNEGTWCADNLLDVLLHRRESDPDRCLCDFTEAKFIREATEEDEKNFGTVFVKDFES